MTRLRQLTNVSIRSGLIVRNPRGDLNSRISRCLYVLPGYAMNEYCGEWTLFVVRTRISENSQIVGNGFHLMCGPRFRLS